MFCDKLLKTSIENYLKAANKRADYDKRPFTRRPGRGGRGRGGGGPRRKKFAASKEW